MFNLKRIRNGFLLLPRYVYARINPTGYARSRGVKINGTVKFYGVPRLNTEPWLISIGDNVHITKDVEFITHDGGTLIFRKDYPDLEITKPIVIGNNVYIGIKSIIMPGVTIGDNVVIGAGSIITKDIPSNEVWAGVPAKKIKDTSDYLSILQRDSLGLGDLSAIKKEKALKKLYNVKG